jgi:UDP-2,3-diacylglucosamine hydrolase
MSPAPLPLPSMHERAAPEGWRAIDLISDLHLAPETPRTLDALEAHLRATPADTVWVLGDLFEVWVGDDSRTREFGQRCVDLLAEAGSRLQLGLMVGNRDFLLGAEMLSACGAVGLADPTVLDAWGRRLLLTHGDALCLEDRDYQRFRAEVRDPQWQRAFLARPLGERETLARSIRQASEARKRGQPDPELWADVDPATAVAWMRGASATEMVHGHTHRPGSNALAPGFERHVLSDWDLDGPSLRAEVLRLTRNGLHRLRPLTAG